MVVLINPNAGSGRALSKWRRIEPFIRSINSSLTSYVLDGELTTEWTITQALVNGEREFVVGGGDGTVNAILNTLMNLADADQIRNIRLGALGLGSSNDFHKPFDGACLVDGIPVNVDFRAAESRDVGCITYEDNDTFRTKYFLVNASIGVTAEANNFFNNPNKTLQNLKRLHTPSATLYAAVQTILSYKNINAWLLSPETGLKAVNLSNLGIVKNPHFSGSLHYPGREDYGSGMLSVHLCHGLSRPALLSLLWALTRGKLDDGEKTRSWSTSTLDIFADRPVAVEYDGEILVTRSARFTVLPKHLKVCQ